jgi:hypothetical protein
VQHAELPIEAQGVPDGAQPHAPLPQYPAQHSPSATQELPLLTQQANMSLPVEARGRQD